MSSNQPAPQYGAGHHGLYYIPQLLPSPVITPSFSVNALEDESLLKKTYSSDGPSRRWRNRAAEPDHTVLIKEQLDTTQRTAQACDRCKSRKLKCDSRPFSCENCQLVGEPCWQVDRITKEKTVRGERERLRTENEQLRHVLGEYVKENEELRAQLQAAQDRSRKLEATFLSPVPTAAPSSVVGAYQPYQSPAFSMPPPCPSSRMRSSSCIFPQGSQRFASNYAFVPTWPAGSVASQSYQYQQPRAFDEEEVKLPFG
ncbi:hypothetical protein KEM55_007040 [Ascosphaera atra]|nr:hypothetical protein KEM55_007040 [Ascosphaera atra]